MSSVELDTISVTENDMNKNIILNRKLNCEKYLVRKKERETTYNCLETRVQLC